MQRYDDGRQYLRERDPSVLFAKHEDRKYIIRRYFIGQCFQDDIYGRGA